MSLTLLHRGQDLFFHVDNYSVELIYLDKTNEIWHDSGIHPPAQIPTVASCCSIYRQQITR
jgi:hypothetical protein